MKRTIKKVDELTLEMTEVVVDDDAIEELTENDAEHFADLFRQALTCSPEEFAEKYDAFQKAKKEFDEVYEPFKENIIKLHEDTSEIIIPKTIVVGGTAKVTYVSPSRRTSVDTKKLKEEEPELAKKYTKTTSVSATVRIEHM